MIKNNLIILIPLILVTLSCRLNNSDSNNEIESSVVTVNNNILPGVDTQTYLLLTNPTEDSLEIPKVTVNGSVSRSIEYREKEEQLTTEQTTITRLDKVIPFNINNGTKSTSRSTSNIYDGFTIGDTTDFNIYVGNDYLPIKFKLKSRTSIVVGDNIELFIWSDNSDTAPDSAITYLEQELENIFSELLTIFGKHWGANKYSNLISESNKDIHILLTDIDDDKNLNPEGIVYGYFNGNDTITSADSNQCLNMVIDSYNYYNGTYPISDSYQWTKDSIESALTLSTIIHEFQHMIQFYNKNILQNKSNRFFNEMFSMIAEDIMANSYLTYTSNGVEEVLSPNIGRLPTFNLFWDENSSFYWDSSGYGTINNYSMSYVLGAYLLRNYGIDLLSEYMSLDNIGISGIIESLNNVEPTTEHTITTLLNNFGTAILKSENLDQEIIPYKFNNKTSQTKGGEVYQIEPINFFNNTIYKYYASGNEINRLRNFDYSNTTYYAAFTPISLHDLNMNSSENWLQFKNESNIYIDLGTIDQNDVVVIDFNNQATDITYKIIY